jgi:hypothetical protein
VLKETKVQDAFVKILSETGDYDFEQISCKQVPSSRTEVTFIFRCRPPKICFIHPSFTVTYDHYLHKVVGEIRYVFFESNKEY